MPGAPRDSEGLTTYDLMDAMRALAAGMVVLNHARNLMFINVQPGDSISIGLKIFYFLSGLGHQAVMIFFVLSGFWITRVVVSRDLKGQWSWKSYLFDRLTRLWIVLVPALILGAMLDIVGRYWIGSPLYLGTQGAISATQDVATTLTLKNAIGNLFFVQKLLVEPLGSNLPLWSLANEFWYYIWFPALYMLLRRRRGSLLFVIPAAITMFSFPQIVPGFACWLCGSLAYLMSHGEPMQFTQSHRRKAMWMAIIWAGALALALLAAKLTLQYTELTDILIAGCFSALLVSLLRGSFRYPSFLKSVSRYGATGSYSLYVVHFPLLLLMMNLWVPDHQRSPSLALFLEFFATFLVILAYGFGFSRLTEMNTKRVRSWVANWSLKEHYSEV